MKINIGKRSKWAFVMTVVLLFLSLSITPTAMALTANDDITYDAGWVRIPYGNGIDDDLDGVIDDEDEPDVRYGDHNVNISDNTVYDTWYDDYIKKGVVVGGSWEELWRVTCSDNVSIPQSQTCYQIDTIGVPQYETESNVVNLVTFYINIPPSKVMNGASEFYYRSPLKWDDTVYDETGDAEPEHWLNIYDEDNNIVWASDRNHHNLPLGPTGYWTAILDGSGYERIYYKINMNFKSEMKYRFEEYVKLQNPGDSITTVDVFMARFQDIGADEEKDTYNFWGTAHPRKIGTECGWSAIFTIGKGLAGGEKIIFGNEDNGDMSICPQPVYGSPTGMNNTASIRIVFPLRTTKPLNISVYYYIESGGSHSTNSWMYDGDSPSAKGVTGTLIFDLNITDPNHTAPNIYYFKFVITNLDEGYDGAPATMQAMTFYMYPSSNSTNDITTITNDSGVCEINAFSSHVEVALEKAAVGGGGGKGPNLLTCLFGIAFFIAGFILVATGIGAIIGIPFIFGAITVSTATAVAIVGTGVAAAAIGSYFTYHGLSGHSIGETLNAMANDALRVLDTALDAWCDVISKVMDALMFVYELLVNVMGTIMNYLALIAEIIWNVMWFVAFVVVVYCWNWILVLFKLIAKGDIEQVFAKMKKPIVKYGKKTIKYSGKYTKTGRLLTKTIPGKLEERAKQPIFER